MTTTKDKSITVSTSATGQRTPSNPLVGLNFLSYTDCSQCGRNIPQWKGQILNKIADSEFYLVETYEWIGGGVWCQALATLYEIKEWQLYNDREWWLHHAGREHHCPGEPKA